MILDFLREITENVIQKQEIKSCEKWLSSFDKALDGRHEKCDFFRYTDIYGKEQFIRWELLPWRKLDSKKIGGLIIIMEDLSEAVKHIRDLVITGGI